MHYLKDFQDPIALNLAKNLSSDENCQDVLSLCLGANFSGHSCIDLDQLNEDDKSSLLLKIQALLPSQLSQDFFKKTPLFFINNCLYTHKSLRAEKVFFNELKRLMDSLDQTSSIKFIKHTELTDQQNKALEKACEKGLLILTGGPGTGKTYTAKKIALHLAHNSPFFKKTIILTAPTSKAAQHLKNSIGPCGDDIEVICLTLHKLVEFFQKKQVYLDASCIIVDESSMIEAPLFAKFMQSLGPYAKVIFMGDPNQLPPVGLGSFFSDLIQLKNRYPLIHHVHLDQTKRFDDPNIKMLVDITLNKKPSDFLDFISHDHEMICSIKEPLSAMTESTFKKLTHFFDETQFYKNNLDDLKNSTQDHIILSTLRKGQLGVDHINDLLSKFFEERSKDFRYFVQPIVLTKSHLDLELFNGETGFFIKDHLLKESFLFVKNRLFSNTSAISFEPSFAISVHKSQGSEYKHVLLMVPSGSENFSKEIIYTAITRVKKTLTLWLEKEPFVHALEKTNSRMSGILKFS